ncbi:unnamed protein product [Caenorhabditis angaria]|uniref:Uncharacterized protein n=1 Tax=Caenorhabditis angaria TaxID=860376 RepID=A0A9P1IEV2_9PELO|nr:unnamed protein product [Caenorhabditis angaria]
MSIPFAKAFEVPINRVKIFEKELFVHISDWQFILLQTSHRLSVWKKFDGIIRDTAKLKFRNVLGRNAQPPAILQNSCGNTSSHWKIGEAELTC